MEDPQPRPGDARQTDLEAIIDLVAEAPDLPEVTPEPATMHRIDAMLELSELAADDREGPAWSRFH